MDCRPCHSASAVSGCQAKGSSGREFEYGAVAFFELQGGLILALWPRTSIARDTGLPTQPGSSTDFTLGHNVRTPLGSGVEPQDSATRLASTER